MNFSSKGPSSDGISRGRSSPARRQDPDAPLRVDLRVPFAVCAAAGFLLLGAYTLLVFLDLPRLALLGAVLLGTYTLFVGVTFAAYAWRLSRSRRNIRTAELLTADIYRLFRSVIDIPYAVVGGDGRVRVLNAAMQSILGARSPLCSIPLSDICPSVTQERLLAALRNPDDGDLPELQSVPLGREAGGGTGSLIVTLNDGRRYRADPYLLRRQPEPYYLLLFHDVGDYLDFAEETNRNRTVLAYIMLDNLQELTQFVRASYRATANVIEETLTDWVASLHGMIREYDRDKYIALFSEEMLDRCVQENFPILEKIMNLRVGDNTFPLSVSMGIADIDGSMEERNRAANAALDMALQRGGNQVALQRRGTSGFTFYGGTHKTMEGNTTVTSRVSVHLLERQLAGCLNVLIMGHSNPDFDAIGAAVGAHRLCRSILDAEGRTDVPVYIVTDKTCDNFRICAEQLAPLGEYRQIFVDAAEARGLVCTETVLILVDVNNPVIFEVPELYTRIPLKNGVHPIAVIDHHRLVGKLPFTPFLHYIEATKSSASEIVAEMLEQSPYADSLCKEEANVMLAGIMLDTHNFTRSAGAQTFEITYYLYGRGAHTGTAREFFGERMDELRTASDFDAHARIYAGVFAVTWLSEDRAPSPDDRIAASKAADKLLSLRGVEASFALAVIGSGVAISGRSKGRINVQLILEKLDGGGHFDMAGAQVKGTVEEALELLRGAIDEYRLQYPELFGGRS
jgi:cyclic-di-AMP phosphodiesterase